MSKLRSRKSSTEATGCGCKCDQVDSRPVYFPPSQVMNILRSLLQGKFKLPLLPVYLLSYLPKVKTFSLKKQKFHISEYLLLEKPSQKLIADSMDID